MRQDRRGSLSYASHARRLVHRACVWCCATRVAYLKHTARVWIRHRCDPKVATKARLDRRVNTGEMHYCEITDCKSQADNWRAQLWGEALHVLNLAVKKRRFIHDTRSLSRVVMTSRRCTVCIVRSSVIGAATTARRLGCCLARAGLLS